LFDHAGKKNRVEVLEKKMSEAGFWEDQEQARGVVAELKSVNAVLKPLEQLLQSADDLDALLEMAGEDAELAEELEGELERVSRQLDQLELKS
ncbi:MAG: PCRF domain-containing protein, partial [Planctomycetales bacterium]|nr:PCRF domain-containing protein [Planctomycetales bacterium]NIP68603.1 PCRF domain-containing protein [Planctomycetales bacterium]